MTCQAKMTSLITVLNPDGTVNHPINLDGKLVWEWIFPKSIIKYRVQTFPEGNEIGKPDEFTFSVLRQDYTYMKQLSDRVYEEATTEQQTIFDAEIVSYLNKEIDSLPIFGTACSDEIDIERTIGNVHSMVHNTNDEGKYEGTYTLPDTGVFGQYAFLISYGYDESNREQTDSKAMSFWDTLLIAAITVSLVVLAILIIWYGFAAIVWLATAGAGYVGLGGGAVSIGGIGLNTGVGAVIIAKLTLSGFAAFAVYSAEFAFLWWLDSNLGATEQFMNACQGYTRNISVGENKYGCVFEDSEGDPASIIHIYGSTVAPHYIFGDDGKILKDDTTFDWFSKNVMLGGGLTLAALITYITVGGD